MIIGLICFNEINSIQIYYNIPVYKIAGLLLPLPGGFAAGKL